MTDKPDMDRVHVNEMVAAVMHVSGVEAGLCRVLPMVGALLKCRGGTARLKRTDNHSGRWATVARWTVNNNTSSVVLLIIGCAKIMGWVLAYHRMPEPVATTFLSITDITAVVPKLMGDYQ
ncbi:hypothetical protein DSCA_21800 [Desulfosarcina alkanivorans]|jgi:hypothetical protein|uniref:Uncharacterized protein n=1 Tax=Desulfosarcina alkanivorans TaxID=571177 RepID=A0A5K7YJD1_9BACT|nr:hypothetical protein [Desulfosarcina alkanivorans]BBO68250.1 hypothetical protein DSCA_21800 [Desulfosarcina alkanivorans]